VVRRASSITDTSASETVLGGSGVPQRRGGARDPWLVQLGVANLTLPQVVAVVEHRV